MASLPRARRLTMWTIWTMMIMLHATLRGCDATPAPVTGNTAEVVISGKKFFLEIAAEDAVRMKGLGGRTSIAEDGGMLFTFSRAREAASGFVMRDCPIDMDIAYLGETGRVLTTYTMKSEPPRAADGSEGKDGEFGNEKYEKRLKPYASKYPYMFVIELKAGTLEKLKVKEGDKVAADWEGLKRRAK